MFKVLWQTHYAKINGQIYREIHTYTQTCRTEKSLNNFIKKHYVCKYKNMETGEIVEINPVLK